MILGLLAAAAWAQSGSEPSGSEPSAELRVPAGGAWAALAEQPLDARAQLALAAALAYEGRTVEAVGIREAWLDASDPAVALEARAALARWLVGEPPHPALEDLLVDVLRGPALPETPLLRARLAELRAAAKTRTSGMADRSLVGAGVRTALAAGDPSAALAATRAAVATAATPAARALFLDDLASVLVVSAEAQKRAGDISGAIANYAVAVALRPTSLPHVRGLGGLLWQSGHLEGAWSLYQRAFALDRDDPATLSAALAVGVAAGHEDAAWALVVQAGPPGPEVEALRRAFERWRGIRDADAAAQAGDLLRAEAGFRALAEAWPEDARVWRGLAGSLTSLSRHEEARQAWREAARLEPLDPWAVIGEADVLVKLGRPEQARARLAEGLQPDAPAPALLERRRVEGRAAQLEAEQARSGGDPLGAIEAYRRALLAEPGPWVYVGVAFLYLEDGQPERALAFCDDLLARLPDHSGATDARILALDALGRHEEALAALDARNALRAQEDAGSPHAAPRDPALDDQREALVIRAAAARARAAADNGDLAGADDLLATALVASPASHDLLAARADVALRRSDAPRAFELAAAALALAPDDPWSRGLLLAAARADGRSEDALLVFTRLAEAQAASDPDGSEGSESFGPALAEARLDVAIAAARTAQRHGRAPEAELALRGALLHAETPDLSMRLAGAWLDLGRTTEALGLYAAVLREVPDNVDALIGRAGAWEASDRLLLSEEHLEEDFDRLGDARLGLALAGVQTRRGAHAAAARTLARVDALPAPVPPVRDRPRLPALPLPSGREGPAAQEPVAASDLRDTRLPEARATLAADRAARASAGVLFITRGGLPGSAQIGAVGVPVEVTTPALGSVRVRAQVVPLHLYADTGTDDGVAASVGILTPEARRVSASAHVGTSPIGFDGGVYPTWAARLALKLVRSLGLAFETVRAPRTDSRASWASEVYAPTGQRFGRASELTIGASLAWSTPKTNLGISGRTGWVEGIGITPNVLGEGVFWVEQDIDAAPFGAQISASGVAQAYARRDDAFVPGQGAYFSPPLHLAGLVELDGYVRMGPARVCASVGGGPRYLGGEPTAFASAGFGAVGTARLGTGVRLSERLVLSIDGRGQLVSDGWHQLGALALLSWGTPAGPADLRSTATLSAAGLALPSAGDACPAP
ncbi:MAG: tetratricopeptide repeat protein [Pseudomonadota bacterium]|nr:tetratricopeptide repeat protein [Pseudomonadota bacterium]